MSAANTSINNVFEGTLSPRDVTKYTLFRGVTDYTDLMQFDLYETGYSYLIPLKIPDFLILLGKRNNEYSNLINSYRHILEWEFRGAQGIEDITSETSEINNGITNINLITKVVEQGGSQFTMNYFERSGSILTKVNRLFLTGIKDPKTQVKRYNGLLSQAFSKNPNDNDINNSSNRISSGRNGSNASYEMSIYDAGPHKEIFHFLLIVTDNTCLNIENAYILASCQPTTSNTSIYNVTKGEIGFSEIPITFNGIPLPGKIVQQKAKEFLKYINHHTCFDEMEFGYSVLDSTIYDLGDNGVDTTANAQKSNAYFHTIEKANNGDGNLFSTLSDVDLADQPTYTPGTDDNTDRMTPLSNTRGNNNVG